MKLRDNYDWIVLGDHPGALLSAALAARLGLSVLVLPGSFSMPARISDPGHLLDPESNYLLGLGRSSQHNGLLSECLVKLGSLDSELQLIQGSQAAPQIVTPRFRWNLSGNDEALARELRWALGDELFSKLGLVEAIQGAESEILSFWLQLPDRLTLSPQKKEAPLTKAVRVSELFKKLRKGVARPEVAQWYLAKPPHEGELRASLVGAWYGAASNPASAVLAQELLHFIVLTRTGASFQGGMSAYREFLMRLARRLGAHVFPKVECRRIFVERGRCKGVQIANQGSVIAARSIAVGCSLSRLMPLISTGGRSWGRRVKVPPRPNGWRFTISITLKNSAIPPGLSPRVIWSEAGAPVLELETADPAHYGLRKPGYQIVFARTLLPYSKETLDPEYQKQIAARILKQAAELIPFLDQACENVYPDFRRDAEELGKVYGFKSLEEIPDNLRYFDARSTKGLGVRSGVDGLFVVSDESFPAWGNWGGTVAAVEAVSGLAHRAGLMGPFA